MELKNIFFWQGKIPFKTSEGEASTKITRIAKQSSCSSLISRIAKYTFKNFLQSKGIREMPYYQTSQRMQREKGISQFSNKGKTSQRMKDTPIHLEFKIRRQK